MKYRTIVADPPWRYDDGFVKQSRTPGKWTGPVVKYALPYRSMSLEEIAALPVDALADRNARLFMWTTNRYLPDAFGIVEAWGFTYKQTLVWNVLNAVNGSVAPNAQFVLVGARGSVPRTGTMPSAVLARGHTKRHSQKPDMFLDLVEQVSPGPYLELFARRQRLGWDTWGDEALPHVELG